MSDLKVSDELLNYYGDLYIEYKPFKSGLGAIIKGVGTFENFVKWCINVNEGKEVYDLSEDRVKWVKVKYSNKQGYIWKPIPEHIFDEIKNHLLEQAAK